MTVSRALRDNPHVLPETSKRIKEAAAKLGYRVDPLVSALSLYRLKKKRGDYHGAIAWIDNWPSRNGFLKSHIFKEYFESATDRAKDFGYRLETIWIREQGMTALRLGNILRTRGIHGLILAPQPRARAHLHLPWDNFAVVTLGNTLARPEFNMVTNHQYHSMVLAIRRLRALGYRRMGLAITSETVERADRNYLAAFLVEQIRLAVKHRIEPFIKSLKTDFNEKNFGLWFRKTHPEVVITTEKRAKDWLRALKVKIPNDVGLVDLAVAHNDREMSGLDQQNRLVGKTAVDLLIGMLQRNEKGIPPSKISHLIESRWIPGKTLRRLTSA